MRYLKYVWPLSYRIKTTASGIMHALLYMICFFVYRAFTMYLNAQAPFSPYYHILTSILLVYIAVGMGLIIAQILTASHRRRRQSTSSTNLPPDSLAFTHPSSRSDDTNGMKRRSESSSRSRSRARAYTPVVIIPPTVETKATAEEKKFRNSANDKGHRDSAVVVFKADKASRPSSSDAENRS